VNLPILRLGAVKDVERFKEHLHSLGLDIPCDASIVSGPDSPLRQPLTRAGITLANRIAIQPMEGWDATRDGNISESMLRRWRRLGTSGAKLIWGCEAAAVSHAGRANPNQLLVSTHTLKGLHQLRIALAEGHRETAGSDKGLLIGLQLTHSGRYCRPNEHAKPEPQILYRHPILDRRLGLTADYPLLTDGEISEIIADFVRAAYVAREAGFDFVDIKHCHGYLGHEFLSAHTRGGNYGGSLENRTRFLKETVDGIRTNVPGLQIGVRVSIFDTVPFASDPARSSTGKLGPGIPEIHGNLIPYRWGFGVEPTDPTKPDLAEGEQFLSLLEKMEIHLVNVTAGSPYYNPHVQRPALYPPSDGYQPPEDPLIGVARQMDATWRMKQKFPTLIFVGTAYTYLQDYLPHVAQAALRARWVDLIGLGRMALTYPELLWDASEGNTVQHKRVCRTFSDCTTAPRKGLPSGCYPLDSYYKNSDHAAQLKVAKART
jgi:2,4-dienoyl-CoA reductase-like NADH-dependent reductase (Old Yellow Enzyme family)